MGAGIRGSECHPMGFCAFAEPNAVRCVADSRRDDRQQPVSRYFHRLCRAGGVDSELPHPRVRLGMSVMLTHDSQ